MMTTPQPPSTMHSASSATFYPCSGRCCQTVGSENTSMCISNKPLSFKQLSLSVCYYQCAGQCEQIIRLPVGSGHVCESNEGAGRSSQRR